MKIWREFQVCCVLALLVLASGTVRAEMFTIVPSLSHFTMTAEYFYGTDVFLLEAQSPGSNEGTFSGSLDVSLDSGGQLVAIGLPTASVSSEDYLPFGQPAIAAGQLTDFPNPGEISYIALRNAPFQVGLGANLAPDGTFPVFGNSDLRVLGGTIDIESSLVGGTLSLSAGTVTLANRSNELGSYFQDGPMTTLTVPFNFRSNQFGFSFYTTGTLVAVHVVPEPGSLALSICAILTLVIGLAIRRRA